MSDDGRTKVVHKSRGRRSKPIMETNVGSHPQSGSALVTRPPILSQSAPQPHIRPHRLYPSRAKIAVAREGSSAPELIGIAFKDMASNERDSNYQWRLANKKCTTCGEGNHFRNNCPLRQKNIERKEEAEEKQRLRLQEEAEKERARVEELMCTPPSNGHCYFLSIPQEIRNQILKYTVGDLRGFSDDFDKFSFQSQRPFQAPVSQLTKAIRRQALQIWLETHTIVLRNGNDMFYFREFCEKCKLIEYVRGLEFPSFHFFNPGQGANRGKMYSHTNGDVELITMCPNLRKISLTLQPTRYDGRNVACHTVEEFKARYSLNRICECPMLKHVVLELKKWHYQEAVNIKPGGDVFSYGEDLSAWFRGQLEARAEIEVLTARSDQRDGLESARLVCWVCDEYVEDFNAETFEKETAKIVEVAKSKVVVRTIRRNGFRRYW